jgi:hypothetical protein
VFVVGEDHPMWLRRWSDDAGWTSWQPLGGDLGSSPSAAAMHADRIDVLARGRDGIIVHRTRGRPRGVIGRRRRKDARGKHAVDRRRDGDG